ncbi:MAG: hypothetical protein LBT25_11125 [Candidatus Symbiothrix sp.]|jgi:hypothetical protein|nr:hypothetical protein [Candidatus Symbiothrix sp.]
MERCQINKKNIFTFGILFVSLIVFYLLALYISAALPSEKIKANIKESAQIIEAQSDWSYPVFFNAGYPLSINYGTDAVMMNIIYNVDSQAPLKSVLSNKYTGAYDFYVCMPNLMATVNEDAPYEYNYARYWHGYIVFLRPLFNFFNYIEISSINIFLFTLLAFLLIVCTAKKIGYWAAITLGLSLIYINFWCIPLALTYLLTFYMVLISALIILIFDIKKEITYLKLIFIIGSLTSFFDLSTSPVVTLGIPLIFIVMKQEAYIRKQSFMQVLLFLFKFAFCWGLGYALTWLMKPVIATVFIPDIISDFVQQILFRMNGEGIYRDDFINEGGTGVNFFLYRIYAMYRNFKAMFFDLYTLPTLLISVLLFVNLLIFSKKNGILSVFYTYVLIACIPYAWYFIAANHSYMHPMFVYRIQMITVFSVLLAYRDVIDASKMKHKCLTIYKRMNVFK